MGGYFSMWRVLAICRRYKTSLYLLRGRFFRLEPFRRWIDRAFANPSATSGLHL